MAKGINVIVYVSLFKGRERVRDYGGSVMSKETFFDFGNERGIYLIRTPRNKKGYAEVQGFVLDGPVVNGDDFPEYVLKKIPEDEKPEITSLVQRREGKDITIKFR